MVFAMRISDLRMFGVAVMTGETVAAIVVIKLPDRSNVFTWRAAGQSLPKGNVVGVGLVTFAEGGVPNDILVDDNLCNIWTKIHWEPHLLHYNRKSLNVNFGKCQEQSNANPQRHSLSRQQCAMR